MESLHETNSVCGPLDLNVSVLTSELQRFPIPYKVSESFQGESKKLNFSGGRPKKEPKRPKRSKTKNGAQTADLQKHLKLSC